MRFLIIGFAFCTHAEIIDRIVATVAKEPILASQLSAAQTLDDLIDDEVIHQEIKKLGLDVSEAEIDLTISNIMKQNRLGEIEFEKALKQSNNMTLPQYREFLKKQFYKRNLIQNKIKGRVASTSSTNVRLQAGQARFKTEAEALKAIAQGNIEFTDLGSISKEDLVPEFSKVVFSLGEGQISKPLKSKDEFIVIQVKKRFEIPLEKVDKQRYEAEVETAFKRYVKELRASAYIERK